jgi:hypothetical protein
MLLFQSTKFNPDNNTNNNNNNNNSNNSNTKKVSPLKIPKEPIEEKVVEEKKPTTPTSTPIKVPEKGERNIL